MPTNDLDDLIKVCERATGGNWWASEALYIHSDLPPTLPLIASTTHTIEGYAQQKANAEFIATFNPQRCLAMAKRIQELEAWQANVQEREAACCPEDVGFDEYIAALLKELKRLRDQIERPEAIRAFEKFCQPEDQPHE
jgi:hypothetical protein